jgi:hypothetical protein
MTARRLQRGSLRTVRHSSGPFTPGMSTSRISNSGTTSSSVSQKRSGSTRVETSRSCGRSSAQMVSSTAGSSSTTSTRVAARRSRARNCSTASSTSAGSRDLGRNARLPRRAASTRSVKAPVPVSTSTGIGGTAALSSDSSAYASAIPSGGKVRSSSTIAGGCSAHRIRASCGLMAVSQCISRAAASVAIRSHSSWSSSTTRSRNRLPVGSARCALVGTSTSPCSSRRTTAMSVDIAGAWAGAGSANSSSSSRAASEARMKPNVPTDPISVCAARCASLRSRSSSSPPVSARTPRSSKLTRSRTPTRCFCQIARRASSDDLVVGVPKSPPVAVDGESNVPRSGSCLTPAIPGVRPLAG